MVLSNSMIIPVLPEMQRALHVSLFRAGLLITAFSIAAALVIPVGGYLSDRWGRKPIIVPALFLFGLGGAVGGLAPLLTDRPYSWILAGRVLQGVGGGGLYQVAMALVGDLVQGRRRTKALGLLEASNGLGKVLSPIIGAAAALIVWYAAFFVYPLLAWLAALAVWFWVKEPPRAQRARQPLPEYLGKLGEIWAEKGVSLTVAFFAGSLAIFFLFGVLSDYSDLLERPYGIFGFAKGLVIAVPVTVMAATSYVSGTVLQKHLARLAKAAVAVGLGLVAAAFVGMWAFFHNLYLLTAAISLMGLGNGLILPALNTMITSCTGSAQRGTVTSLYGTVRFVGAAAGPPVFSMVVDWGRTVTFLGAAALSALALVLSMAFIDQRKMLPPGMGDKDRRRPQRVRRAGFERAEAPGGRPFQRP
ncbi:MAG: MFS transporter [Firmicutes bacterium]|nr:MFS transporter [Bacillota bacterium]